ncbi:DUF4192 domain-containing protein [Kitasatospora kifunensis]|uniref:DUF4192 domain-containing protein n=1 Tax=Kitasatospora kifunensis TaxID=58351 RepID=A0A7W7R690_KITKI|nr:DUF4192 domain-containing protein [Kitasatospora kifunensis]MBB4925661.1 hypothetical protein [Kitasatospora kifunensis]
MTHDDSTNASQNQLSGHQLVRMRGPADMAAMLPYLLGFYPDDSIVAVGLHGSASRQGGAIRLDIPEDPNDWPIIAVELARLLITLSEQRDRRPDAVLLYLCRDPEPGARPVRTQLRPLADQLLRVFREFEVPVKESLCVSGGRWWSFLCSDPACCDPHGTAILAGQEPRAVVAAATYAGLAPRGSRKAIGAALAPIGPPVGDAQRRALERLVPSPAGLTQSGAEERTGEAAARLIAQAMADSQAGPPTLDEVRAARLIVALQDRENRDRAAEYAEPVELAAAQRLWRFLARRCVPPFEEFARAPLTLLAWTSWLAGDTATSRVALGRALDLDPSYTLAELLYQSLNGGLEPDGLLNIVRAERARRTDPDLVPGDPDAAERTAGPDGEPPTDHPPKLSGDAPGSVEAIGEPTEVPADEDSEASAGDPPPPRPARRSAAPGTRGRAGPGSSAAAAGSVAGSAESPHRAEPTDRGLIPPQRGRSGSGRSGSGRSESGRSGSGRSGPRKPPPPTPSPEPNQSPGDSAAPPGPSQSSLAYLIRCGGPARRKTTTSTIGA